MPKRWFGHVQRMDENIIPKRVLYMNLGTTRLRGRPRNWWQDEVREDGRVVGGGEGWREKVHNREEWKKLLRTARNRRILHVAMEWMFWVCVWSLKLSSMECACSGLYCHLWSLRLHHVIAYLINGTNFGKKKSYRTQNVCFDFLYNFCVKHFSF